MMSGELPRSFKPITVWLLLGVAVFVGIPWGTFGWPCRFVTH